MSSQPITFHPASAPVPPIVAKTWSVEDIVAEADTLYERWPKLPLDDRRKIAEAVCEKIVIGNGEIDITYSCLPTSEELCKNLTTL